ncbi:MAG: hypothetical protein ACE3L7_25075 [Candidatus Pristimantibacillus sp.]
MLWTALWFFINIGFVASLIVFLFMHRAYSEAKDNRADTTRLNQTRRNMKLAGVLSAVLFVAMCASFLINMKLNG